MYCHGAHNILKDFRRIYDYKKPEIIKLQLSLEKFGNKEENSFLLKYTQLIKPPVTFSLEDFKVLPCKLGTLCTLDTHTCYNYHDETERRRPPLLFRYKNEVCPQVKPDRNSNFYPHLCAEVNYLFKYIITIKLERLLSFNTYKI